jgi:hypothetical protein
MAEGSEHFTAVLNFGGGDLILKRIAQRDLSRPCHIRFQQHPHIAGMLIRLHGREMGIVLPSDFTT